MNDESPKTEYEQRREAKEQSERARDRRRSAKKRITIALISALAVLLAWWAATAVRHRRPLGEDFSRPCPDVSREHIAVDAEHEAYQSNPPCGGPHYGQTAAKRFYDSGVPDEYVIHNLEHGDIWIAYHPRVSDDVRRELKNLALPKVVITPREANTEDIAVVAWGRIDAFNLADGELPIDRIRDFITRYRNKGPEQVPAGMDTNTFN